MSSFDSKVFINVSPSIINDGDFRHITKEFDEDNGITEVVEFVENRRLYRMVHDCTGFIQNTLFTLTPRGWKKISYGIPDYKSWYSQLIKDDIKYLEMKESAV